MTSTAADMFMVGRTLLSQSRERAITQPADQESLARAGILRRQIMQSRCARSLQVTALLCCR